MRFDRVGLWHIGAAIPEEIWTSEEIEQRLHPLYDRLKLPQGRLHGMSGVAQRRVWQRGMLPSTGSVAIASRVLEASGVDPASVGALVHGSVCRDSLEPATAARVHHELGLPANCWVYDVSNACLGIMSGAIQIAQLIQSGHIRAGIVVGTENARMLLETTIAHLNSDESLTRKTIKGAFASLTIGSAAAAWLLVSRDDHPNATSFDVATTLVRTEFHGLCESPEDAGAGMSPLMETDSERLMAEGIATGAANFDRLSAESGWQPGDFDRSVCHQVGSRHRLAMLEAMSLPPENDPITFDRLGNTGSVALPTTLATGVADGFIRPGHRVAMLGIGSGIHSVMVAAPWGQTGVVWDPTDW